MVGKEDVSASLNISHKLFENLQKVHAECPYCHHSKDRHSADFDRLY